ncbi:PREDICTED: diffuse panbronchiolitis critical region protein 1-like [Chrysochloris asiatica]|uniref:Diffuse panbronchiolitis critical region protein 1-like n=1 Tax=Chrysochloris asiatica TaxID=185453 RepID=A0A9B0U4G7_CHRAS|nr:PREDICTED: diffuse panbronchiolitis critical region protein 1-like [Chrysochloris asiatica]
MAQTAYCLHFTSTFGGCLLILLALWEAGATTVLQKTGESTTPDPLFLLTPGLIYNTHLDHTSRSPPGNYKSTETHKLKYHCNTTNHLKPIHEPIETPQTAEHKNSKTHYRVPTTSEQKLKNQENDSVIRNGRSVDHSDATKNNNRSSDAKNPDAFYLTRTHVPWTQNTENKDPEDDGGPNSYPVYLMEQQTLGKDQIPSSR